MNFKLKNHPYYLYISIFIVSLFFILYSIISNRITKTTKNLNDYVVQRNIQTKYISLKFDFEKLNSFIHDAKNLIETTKSISKKKLNEKLSFTVELATLDKSIDNGFIFFLKNDSITNATFFNNKDKNYQKEIARQLKDKSHSKTDTIIKFTNQVYYRKILNQKLIDGTRVFLGYDINLLKYQKLFSENQFLDGSYSVLTTNQGICILHPDNKYIGVKIDSFFRKTSPKEIIQNNTAYNNKPTVDSLITTRVTSEYLNLDVFRYFKTIPIDNEQLILMVNFPVEIAIKENIKDVKQYFLWMSLLALCTFMLLLGIARIQLRKEFSEKLRSEKEKEKLAISNEKIKRENTVLQLNQLKKKMNPHFLFNSLNSLLALINIDTEMSQKFTLKLAEVYRYLLEERNSNLITVKEELNFLDQYFFLHKIRFKDSLHLTITHNCDKKFLLKKIPFLALETLVENAIKHNKITKQNPLFIKIIVNDDSIVVTNNYNPRKTKQTDSHNIGLNYLNNSYRFHNINTFKTEIINKKFKCFLPLLS